jgi:hypothetical protein
MNPNDRAMDWTDQTLLERMQWCRSMLHVHSLLSEAENRNVGKRLKQWLKRLERHPVGKEAPR